MVVVAEMRTWLKVAEPSYRESIRLLIRLLKVSVSKPGSGARLAIDVGTVRIGDARCSVDQIMAVPEATIEAGPNALDEIVQIIEQFRIDLVYVGNPISMKEKVTESTLLAQNFALELANKINIGVHLLDERLTTVSATNQLKKSSKSTKASRSVIDQVAAVLLLDHALAIEKSTSRLAGEPVHPTSK